MADVRADVDKRDVLVAPVGGQRRRDQPEGLLRRVGLDVHDARLQPGGFGGRDAVLDLFLARRGDQDLDLVGACSAPGPAIWKSRLTSSSANGMY